MKQRKQQLQKANPIPLVEQLIQVGSTLERNERIALIKALAQSLNEPLYTTEDLKVAVVQHLEAYRRNVVRDTGLIQRAQPVKGRWMK